MQKKRNQEAGKHFPTPLYIHTFKRVINSIFVQVCSHTFFIKDILHKTSFQNK